MKSHLIRTSTIDMPREQWLSFRDSGIGASEMASVLGVGYTSPIEMFYRKLEPTRDVEAYYRMWLGRKLEPLMADNLRHWDFQKGTLAAMMENEIAGNKVTHVQKVNAYIVNPAYPWIFVSFDLIISKRANGAEGAAELKTISRYEEDRWINGIPHSHVIQINTQMLVGELTWGVVPAMVEFSGFNVYPFEPNTGIINEIVTVSHDFWYNKVLPARKFRTMQYEAERNFNMKLWQECEIEITKLEPDLIGSENEDKFLTEKHKCKRDHIGLIPGTEQDYDIAKELRRFKNQIKEIEGKAQQNENKLKNRLREGLKLDFGSSGYVSWSGNPRRFINKIKE